MGSQNTGYPGEGRRKRNIYFSMYTLLQLSLFLTTGAYDDDAVDADDHIKLYRILIILPGADLQFSVRTSG